MMLEWTRPPNGLWEKPQSEPAHVIPTYAIDKAQQAFRHELGMLYDIGGVSNEARNQHIAGRQFNVAPQLLFMFVAGVGSLKTVCTNSDTQH
jgi:hypothetical protein